MGAAAFVGASSTRIGAIVFLVAEVAMAGSTACLLVWPDKFLLVVLVPWPVAQWAVLGVVFLAAMPFGWRMRPDFLKG